MTKNEDRTRGVNLRDIPGLAAMLAVERWCCWYWRVIERKDGTKARTKVPVIPGTGIGVQVNGLVGVAGYDAAVAGVLAETEGAHGVGWRMVGDLGRAALDLDHCRDARTGKIDAWALAILAAAPGAYREVTPSGTGMRIIGRLGGPGGGPEAFQGWLRVGEWVKGLEGPDSAEERAWWGGGTIRTGAAVEIFHACARFITVTGWEGVGDCEVDIGELVEWLMERASKKTIKGHASAADDEGLSLIGHIEDVIAALEIIPNDDLHWNDWMAMGLATVNASKGSETGWEAFEKWSAKSGSHNRRGASDCRDHWEHWKRHPGDRIGIGKLMIEAERAQPGWVRPSQRPFGGSGGNRPAGGVGGVVTEGNTADAFAAAHADALRFDHTRGKWSLWDGARWKREETKLAYRWAHAEARRLAVGKGKSVVERAGRASFAAGVERLAQADRAFAVTHEAWDNDPWSLGTPAGVIDLRTGTTRDARPEDYITRLTAVAPVMGEDCPLWLKFLGEATGNDQGMIGFLRRWFGYCLTGITQEHALVFIHGDGGNGKGVVMNTVFGILGDHAVNAAMETFVVTRGDKHSTDLAMLDGARMVMASEVEEGQTWAEARIKAITGGDPITARFMRQDNFTYTPKFKLTISGNHKPALRGVDNATRRRFNIVPFNRRPALPDPELPEKLKTEWAGILRWMINGCLEWQRIGLGAPASVAAATDDYFESQDFFGRWIEDRCNLGWGLKSTPAALLRSFEDWCRENREEMTDSRRLRGALEKVKGVYYAKTDGNRIVSGIELKGTTAASEGAETNKAPGDF